MSPTESLGVSWSSLISRVQPSGILARWAAAEPPLAGLVTLDELADVVHRPGNAARADAVLGALARLAACDGGDDVDAALLVAHLLANGSRTLAMSMRDLSVDIDDLIAGQLRLQIRTFPWQQRTQAIARSLLLDTRKAVLAELRPFRSRAGDERVFLVDPIDGAALSGPTQSAWAGHDAEEYERELVDVLIWARSSGVVNQRDVVLLIDLVRAAARTDAEDGVRRGLNVAAEIAEVAALYGVNEKTIRRRRDRALTALRRASAEYLAAVA